MSRFQKIVKIKDLSIELSLDTYFHLRLKRVAPECRGKKEAKQSPTTNFFMSLSDFLKFLDFRIFELRSSEVNTLYKLFNNRSKSVFIKNLKSFV